MNGLTRRQYECLQFIRTYVEENDGVGPSYDEIAENMMWASRGAVHRVVKALNERGAIEFIPGAARSIRPKGRWLQNSVSVLFTEQELREVSVASEISGDSIENYVRKAAVAIAGLDLDRGAG